VGCLEDTLDNITRIKGCTSGLDRNALERLPAAGER
jgi:hypothetical protein